MHDEFYFTIKESNLYPKYSKTGSLCMHSYYMYVILEQCEARSACAGQLNLAFVYCAHLTSWAITFSTCRVLVLIGYNPCLSTSMAWLPGCQVHRTLL